MACEINPERKGKVVWTLTDKGKIVADNLYQAEKTLKECLDTEKYYKR
jgi:hypothetical protein